MPEIPQITENSQKIPEAAIINNPPPVEEGYTYDVTLTPMEQEETTIMLTPIEEPETPDKTQTKSALQAINKGFNPTVGWKPENERSNLGKVFQTSETHSYDPVADVIKNIPAEYQDKALNAITFAATHGITPSEAFELHDTFIEEYKKRYKENFGSPPLWKKVKESLTAGMGDVYTTFGKLGKRYSKNQSDKTILPAEAAVMDALMDNYIEFGNRLKLSFIPPEDPSEFNPRKLLDVDYLATTAIRSVPFSLSLLPAGIVGAYTGHRVGTKLVLGEFGKLAMTSLFGAAVSRPLESAFEAQSAADEVAEKGGGQEEQDRVFDEVYKNNLYLTGLDAAEFATALFPMSKVISPNAKRVLLKRILAAGGSIVTTGIEGAVEEREQEKFVMNATDPNNLISFFDTGNPRLNEATGIGFVFGAGFGAAGNIWTSLTDTVTKTMPDKVRDIYEETYAGEIESGMDSKSAAIIALDKIADTPEGKAHIETVMADLKAKATGQVTETKAAPVDEPIPLTEEVTEEEVETEFIDSKQVFDELVQSENFDILTDEEIVNRLEGGPAKESVAFEQVADIGQVEITSIDKIPLSLVIEVTAIKARTGKKVKITSNAREAFIENEQSFEKYQSLIDCLGG